MRRRFDLERESKVFADELSTLLNGTICTGVRITCVVSHQRLRTILGVGINKRDQSAMHGIPVVLGKGSAAIHIGLLMRLEADHSERYLMVTSSVMTLSLDARVEHLLLHYDYERDKESGYPEAHLQVCATSPDWEQLRRRQDDVQRPLAKLHLPVGGRRFRPTLEDLVEFLIAEDLAEGRDGWRDIIEDSRARFRETQLRAAIRRNPEIALDCLRAEGHLS